MAVAPKPSLRNALNAEVRNRSSRGDSRPLASPFIVTLEEVGSDVVATGSGQIDLTGLSYDSNVSAFFGTIAPSAGFLFMGDGDGSAYTGVLSATPVVFEGGGFNYASSTSGDKFGVWGAITVPLGYVSDTALASSSIYNNWTFASLGVTPGTYVWTWGSGADQRVTLQIGAVPLPATLPLFASGLAGLGWLSRRKRKQIA